MEIRILRIRKMPEQIYREKGGIMCPGKVTANVSFDALWNKCERINYKLIIRYKWIFPSPKYMSALNFKIYSGENCFAMNLITLKFSLLKKIFVIFLNTNFHISSQQPDNWNSVSQYILKYILPSKENCF